MLREFICFALLSYVYFILFTGVLFFIFFYYVFIAISSLPFPNGQAWQSYGTECELSKVARSYIRQCQYRSWKQHKVWDAAYACCEQHSPPLGQDDVTGPWTEPCGNTTDQHTQCCCFRHTSHLCFGRTSNQWQLQIAVLKDILKSCQYMTCLSRLHKVISQLCQPFATRRGPTGLRYTAFPLTPLVQWTTSAESAFSH